MNEEKKSGGLGCLKIGGIGCLVMILLLTVAGFMVRKAINDAGGIEGWVESLFQKGGAQFLEATASTMLDEMNFPLEDREALMGPIQGLGEEISAGNVSMEQAIAIVENLFEGPFLGLVLSHSFEHSYMKASGLTEEELAAGRLTINRFQQGLVGGSLDVGQIAELEDYVMTTKAGGEKQLKKSLTDEELKECLAVMKKAADDAQVPVTSAEIDLPGIVQKSIDSGLTAPLPSATAPTDDGDIAE